jgi:hypothetical protein
MRHRAPRTLDFLKSFTFPRSSRYLLAGRRRAGWLIANQKTRVTLAMASVMVLACAAVVAATEIPGDDDSVAATDAPTSAAHALRSGTAEQVSRSSGRTPWETSDDAPTQNAPDQQAPAPERPQPGSDGAGVPSPEDEPSTPDEPAPVPSPELPSQTPTDGGGLGVSSPPSLDLPTSAPTESSADPEDSTGEESTDESSDDWQDSSGSDSGEESSEDESATDQTAPETEITSSPTVTDSAVSASSFEFTANESATFLCSLDGQAYVPCGSPTEYSELSPGWHTFAVQATDATGNVDPSPAQVSWLTTGADSAHLVDEVTPSEDSLLP